MNDEQFELTISDLAGSGTYYADIADELRARDTAQREALKQLRTERRHDAQIQSAMAADQKAVAEALGIPPGEYSGGAGEQLLAIAKLREALARVEADHEANSLEYGEALILIGQVLDCRSLEDLNAVRRNLNEFMDRYSLRPVPDVDIVQAEQQEAQDAQLDKDARIALLERELDRERERADMAEVELQHARAALATQPVEQLWAVHAQGPDDLYAAFSREDAEAFAAGLNALPCPPGISVSAVVIESPWPAAEHWKYLAEQWKYLADKEQESNSPPAAAHGDEAVQYRLLRAGEIIKATDELLRDDCTSWQPMGDGPQIGIGWGWHAGLMPVRRIDVAMRAQGDGEDKS